ncbi:MAG: hypothetical protein AAGJ40_04420 [Planctomycetota bacterium]
MSLQAFEKEIHSLDGLSDTERTWFPKWVRRYSLSVRKGCVQDLTVNRQTAIRFSRTLLQCGAPAWQRWQAVRALACYRDLVLKRSEPDLSDVILTLARLGRSERNID